MARKRSKSKTGFGKVGADGKRHFLPSDRKTLLVADASEDYDNAFTAFRNNPNALVIDVNGLNTYDVMNADRLIFTQKAAETAGEVLA